jgi:hypothetical protein
VKDQRDAINCRRAIRLRVQISAAQFQLCRRISRGDLPQPIRFGGIAKKAANIGLSVLKQARNHVNAEESARAGNEYLHACVTG